MMVISETRVVCSEIICLSLLSIRNSNWWIKTVLKFSKDNIVSFLRFWLFLKQTLFQTFRKYNDEIFATGRLSNNDQLLLSPCSLIKWPQTHLGILFNNPNIKLMKTRAKCSEIICLSLPPTQYSNWWIKAVFKFPRILSAIASIPVTYKTHLLKIRTSKNLM